MSIGWKRTLCRWSPHDGFASIPSPSALAVDVVQWFPAKPDHSPGRPARFSATERFISKTKNATAKVNTAAIQKQSK